MDESIHQKLQDFFSNYEQTSYSKGDIIIFAKQAPKGVAFLEKGRVEQYDISPEGNKITVNVFKPQAFFPMSWAIRQTPNSYFFGALDAVTVRIADAEATVSFIKSEPDILFDLLSRVYRGTEGLLRKLFLSMSDNAFRRLLFELLIEANRFGKPVNKNGVSLEIQQVALASRTGLARETVSRELHKMQDLQLIRLEKNKIILQLENVEACLEFVS